VDNKAYGVVVDSSQFWAARIDLAGVLEAAVKVGENTNKVDLTLFVFFLSTQ
jgi:hypothetical protein